MEWLNEPPAWREQDGVLSVTTAERTDFWRETHYGFVRDDGHLRFACASGDYTAAVRCVTEQGMVFFVTSGPSAAEANRLLEAIYRMF